MRSLSAAMLYPGIGILEFTNLSVGRGTPTPFEHIAAPYIDSKKLLADLESQKLPGIKFTATGYTPDASKFSGESCHGIKFTITDRETFRSFDTGLIVAKHLTKNHSGYESSKLSVLMLHPETLAAIRANQSNAEIRKLWADELDDFRKRRAGFLIYD